MNGTITIVALCVLIATGAFAPTARAAGFVVTSANDSGDPIPGDGVCGDSSGCTFRAAVDEANALLGPDTITFVPDLPRISLTLGTVQLVDSGTLVQGNAGKTIIDGLLNTYNSSLVRLNSSCAVAGLELRRSRSHGVEILGSDNRVGGDTPADRVVISGCGLDNDSASGIWIHGEDATRNVVANCLIGVTANGGTAAPNPYGITVGALASGNQIGGLEPPGRNLISGNLYYGVRLTTNAAGNRVLNCSIGCDITGARPLPNLRGGMLLDNGARANRIGGDSLWARNLISGNDAAGMTIQGSETSANTVAGNLIGIDATGVLALGNTGPGILIRDRAHHTLIGDSASSRSNIITGNGGDGVRITGVGCVDNHVVGSLIGVDTSGYASIGNGQISGHGIYIGDGASRSRIGGTADSAGNVISGNWGMGICISRGAQNEVIGNCIGVSVGSVSSAPNAGGVTIRDGSSLNVIGGIEPGSRNVISGNRGAIFPLATGVAILGSGTDRNRVIGNVIGSDITGTRPMRNGSCGVLIGDGAQFNEIGGPTAAERNVISGNGYGTLTVELGSGVHLFGTGTSYNSIQGNYIGVGLDGVLAVPNAGNGIGIYDGATENFVGGDTPEDGNLIAVNKAYGVYITDPATRANSLRMNLICDNDSLGIVIRSGAQDGIAPPVLSSAQPDSAFGTCSEIGGTVDIYEASPDPSGFGEGGSLLGSGSVDSTGHFRVGIAGANVGDTITAIVTDANGSSSQFARNAFVQDPLSIDESGSESDLPSAVSLSPNYPNPFNQATVIEFALPRTSHVELAIFDVLGRKVMDITNGVRKAGVHRTEWSGLDSRGVAVGSGVYFCRLTSNNTLLHNKMLLLK